MGRGSSKLSGGGGSLIKAPLDDVSAYSGYARTLANVVKGDEVYQLQFNGGKAFADAYINSQGDLRIDYIGSTGKGAGSELLAQLAEKALAENRTMSWMADNSAAKNFYKHIGVNIDAIATRRYGTTQYSVRPSDLPDLIRRLRKQ